VIKRPDILEVGNHAKVRRVLEGLAGGTSLAWYHDGVRIVARHWFLLARQHLRVAQQIDTEPRFWRSVVSRAYYAGYNCSRCVRYLVRGSIKFDASDHQEVGDLPDDFPQRAVWSTFLTDMRKDRNLADYEPWKGARLGLSIAPTASVARVREFLKVSRSYLLGKGISI